MSRLDHSQRSDNHLRPASSTPSRTIGRYRIERELGRGAFGVVYLAHSSHLDRQVALKIMLDPDLANPEDLARFLLEAQVAAKLRHPGIVKVHDMGQDDGRPFFVMDYCPGETLHARLEPGPLAPREAAEIVAALARSMAAAHEQGVLHRDLKPANVILDSDSGQPLITDFGLARDRSLLRSMTRTGDVLGTPLYMSPEQIRGDKRLDHRADLYSLGAVLYRCLTGEPPLRGRNFFELAQLVQDVEPPPPSKLRPGIPLQLDSICLRALAKDPEDRQADCSELREDLEAFLEGRPVAIRDRPVQRDRSRWVLASAGLAVAAAAGITAFALRPSGQPPPQASAPQPTEQAPTETTAPSTLSPLALLELAHEQRQELEAYEVVLATLDQALAGARQGNDKILSDEARIARGELQLARGRYAEVLLLEQLDTPEALLLAALAHLAQDHDILAIRSLDRLAELAGSGQTARRGRVLRAVLESKNARGRGRWERRRQLVGELERELETGEPDALLLAVFGNTRLFYDWEPALADLAHAARLAPDNATVYLQSVETLERHVTRLRGWPDRVARRRGSPVTEDEVLAVEAALRNAWDRYLELTIGSRSSRRGWVLRERGVRRLAAGDVDAAWSDLQEALELDPHDLEIAFGAARACRLLGRRAEADRLWRKAWACGPSLDGRWLMVLSEHDGEALGGRVPTLADDLPPPALRDFLAATAFADSVEALCQGCAPGEREAVSAAVSGAAQGTNWAELSGLVEAAADRLLTGAGALALATLLSERDDPQGALDLIARAREWDVDAVAARRVEAHSLRRLGRVQEATVAYESLRDADPTGLVGLHAAGELALLRGDSDGARRAAAEALAVKPDDLAALGLQALAWSWEDPQRAIGLAIDARAIHGDLSLRPLLARTVASLRAVELGHADQFPEVKQQILLARSAGVDGLQTLCQAYLRLLEGRRLTATAELCGRILGEAQRRAPQDARVYALQGRLALFNDDPEAAAQAFDRAKELDPELVLPGE